MAELEYGNSEHCIGINVHLVERPLKENKIKNFTKFDKFLNIFFFKIK